MAGGTGLLKIDLAGPGIPGENVDLRRVVHNSLASGVKVVQPCCYLFYLLVGDVDSRHALLGSPTMNNGRYQFTVLILKNHCGPQQIRSHLTASGIGAMAESTTHTVGGLTPIDYFLGIFRPVRKIQRLSGDRNGSFAAVWSLS